jgi:hypothetical protein
MSNEQSVAELDAFILEQHKLYMLLFNIILRHDDKLRLDVAEQIRKMLLAPTEATSFSPALSAQLQSLRQSLLNLQPQSDALTSALFQPSIRPVE